MFRTKLKVSKTQSSFKGPKHHVCLNLFCFWRHKKRCSTPRKGAKKQYLPYQLKGVKGKPTYLTRLYFDFCVDIQHTSGYDVKSNHGMYHFVLRKEISLLIFFNIFLLLMINVS